MIVKNYEIKADQLFGGVGYIKELGDYSGYYSDEAYKALEIEDELQGDEWCDLMVSDNNNIYAVAGDVPGHSSGNFFFKKLFDGVEGNGEFLERIGKKIATYNVYYEGTNCVDYSIRFIKLPNDTMIVYNTKEIEAYISSEDELSAAREDKEQYPDDCGYWD